MRKVANIKWSSIFINGLVTILIGSYFVFFSEDLSRLITYVLAAGLALAGLIFLITYYAGKSKNKPTEVLNLVQGIVYASIGIVIFINKDLMGDIILYIIGLWLLVTGVSGIFYALKLKNKIGNSVILLVSSIIVAALGISVFFFFENVKTQTVGLTLGCITVLLGVFILYHSIPVYRFNRRTKKEEKALKTIETNQTQINSESEILKTTESNEKEAKTTLPE